METKEETKKHASNFKDLTGQRFGRLVVVRHYGKDKHRGLTWLCKCDCGNEKVTAGRSLRSGSTKSCGCLNDEKRQELHENNLIDLTDKRFGRLLVIKRVRTKKGKTFWECECDCGKTINARADALVGGTKESCGCLYGITRHGLSNHPVYVLFYDMKSRCHDKKCKAYKNYGGRGICICNEWLEDKASFLSWAISNGWKKGLQIDRKDNNGDYSPSNCTFTTRAINSAHRRTTRHFIIHGKYFTSGKEAGKTFNVSEDTIRYWCGLQNNKYPAREGCISFNPYGEE